MILATWNPPPAPRRSFDLYETERRIGHAAFITALIIVRAGVLARYRLADVSRNARTITRLGRTK